MAVFNSFDPCLLFFPGELPVDIQDRIDSGKVVVPTNPNTTDPLDPIIAPPIIGPPGTPGSPGGPTTEGGGGGGGPGGPGGPGQPEDDGGGEEEPPEIPVRWKCETITHTVGAGESGPIVITRKVCTSTLDQAAPFKTFAECFVECGNSVIINDPEITDPPVEEEPEEPPFTEYDESEIPYTTEVNNFLPNYLPVTDGQQESLQSNTNVPVTAFSAQQTPSVNYLLQQQPTVSIKTINEKLVKLSATSIKTSINKQVADIAYNLLEPDGRKAPENRITAAFQMYLLQGKARRINTNYLLSLQIRAALASVTSSARFINYITPRYGANQSNQLVNRLLNAAKTKSVSTQQNLQIPKSDRALARALRSKKSVDYRQYSDGKTEHLKLWNILPEDIYAKAVITDQEGNPFKINIKNDITLLATTSGAQPVPVSLNNQLFQISVETSSGIVKIPLETQLHRAYTLNNTTQQACLFDTKVEDETILTVTSPSSLNLELRYNTQAARPSHYILMLDSSTIRDSETKKSRFVRTTLADYKLETDPAVIQDAIQYKVYPWIVMPVYHDDPILGHFTTSTTYTVESNDFSLDEFGDDLSGPIFVRKIPKCLVVIPTDRYDYLIYNGQSILQDWNQRTLSFVNSPDPNYHNTGFRSSWTKVQLAYPNTNIENDVTETGLIASYETSVPILNNTFITGIEPARTENPYRVATKVVSALNSNYNSNNGIMWSDLYTRLTEQEYKTLRLGVSNRMLEKLRKGEKTGVRLVHDTGVAEHSRLLDLKPNKSDTSQIYLRRS